MTNNKLYGVIITIVFHSIILFLALYLTLHLPDPPPKESAILIAFGSENFTEVTQQPSAVAPQPTSVPELVEEEETLTQDNEEAPAIQKPKPKIKPKVKHTNPKESTQKPATNPTSTPVIPTPTPPNPRAIYPGGRSTTTTNNTTGSAGDPLGSPEGVSPTGSPYGSKEGASLEGRSLVGNLPKPTYNTQESGKIIIKIWVNKNGDVIKAEFQQKGSTLQNALLTKMSEEAAIKAKFNNIEGNTDIQMGHITYIFKLN